MREFYFSVIIQLADDDPCDICDGEGYARAAGLVKEIYRRLTTQTMFGVADIAVDYEYGADGLAKPPECYSGLAIGVPTQLEKGATA